MALRRFSRIGHAAVVIVLATGLVNTWLVLGMWPLDASSSYKTLLLAKIALVTVMLVLALLKSICTGASSSEIAELPAQASLERRRGAHCRFGGCRTGKRHWNKFFRSLMAPPRRRYASTQCSNCCSKDCFAGFAVGRRPVVNYRPGSIPASTAGQAGYQVSDSFTRRRLGGLRRGLARGGERRCRARRGRGRLRLRREERRLDAGGRRSRRKDAWARGAVVCCQSGPLER